MAERPSDVSRAAQDVAKEAFHATDSGNAGGNFSITKVAVIAASVTAITLGAIYAGYKLYAKKMDDAVKRGLGGDREDQQVR